MQFFLDGSFVYTAVVQPIALPEANSTAVGEVTMIGWGSTSTTIISNQPNTLQVRFSFLKVLNLF